MESIREPVTRTYPSVSQSFGITGIMVAIMLLLSPVNFGLNDMVGREASIFVYYLMAMGLSFAIVNKIRKNVTGENSFVLTLSNPRIIPLISVAALALLFGIISPLACLIPIPEFFKQALRTMAEQKGILSFATMVIAAPIMEELIFRGIMLEGLLKKYTPLKAILISSLLFGLVHLNPWQFLAAFIIGTFAGWVYYKTGSLMPAILIHGVVNLTGFIIRYFSDIETALNETIFEMYGGVTNLILVVTGSIIIICASIYMLKHEFNKDSISAVPTRVPD